MANGNGNITWRLVATGALVLLMGVGGYFVRSLDARVDQKLDISRYESECKVREAKDAERDRLLRVIYNAHVPESMRIPVNGGVR